MVPPAERVADLCRPYAASRDSVISVQVPSKAVFTSVNPVEIEESLINLIRNGLESREKAATVDIRLTCEETRATILVDDDGPGISEEEQKRAASPEKEEPRGRKRDRPGVGVCSPFPESSPQIFGQNAIS